VVQLDDTRTLVRRIGFTAPISGLVVLEQGGLEVVTANFDWGTAVCSIAGVGCPAEDCFCGGDTFWNYATWDGAAWQGYPVGPAAAVISQTGAVEGWRWGEFEGTAVPAPQALAAQSALDWLQAGQVITADSDSSQISPALETLLAVAANGMDAAAWRGAPDQPALLDYVLRHTPDHSRQGVAEAGKLAVALAGAAACWPAGAVTPTSYYSPTIGALAVDAGFLSWGILGALALGEVLEAEELAGSVAHLTGLALPEGGWEWSPGWGRDTNSTSLAIQALVAAGAPVSSTEVVSGLAYLKSAQLEGGGFSYDPSADWGQVADANSTAYVLQALAAVGADAQDEAWQVNGVGPVDFLLSLQEDGGALAWQPDQPANLGATQQAIPALLGQPYPLRRMSLDICTTNN
jgi:hypothetical protein